MTASNLPPGAGRVERETGHLRCSECEELRPVTLIRELGSAYAEPEESECCGAPWDEEEEFVPYTRDDYLADHEDEFRGPR